MHENGVCLIEGIHTQWRLKMLTSFPALLNCSTRDRDDICEDDDDGAGQVEVSICMDLVSMRGMRRGWISTGLLIHECSSFVESVNVIQQ